MRRTRWSGVLAILLLVGGCDDGPSSGGDGGARRDGGGSSGTDAGGSSGTDAGMLPEMCAGGPLGAPVAGCRPAVLPSTGDVVQDCVNRINQLRAECQCLPPLERWNEGESCGDQQAQYDSEMMRAHGGFSDRICSPSGRGQNECPGWGSEAQVISGCLQAMWDEGPGEPFSEHGHYINMTNPAHSRVACGFYTTPSGQVWAVQNFQ
ncbi:MAG: CAP domain-containing protein [Sandaracinaceae bacterium]